MTDPARRVAAGEILATYHAIDTALADAGFPRPAEWWQDWIGRFILSGRRVGTIRKGRRVGASTLVLPRLAIAYALSLAVVVPRGQVGTIALLSVRRTEASNRIVNLTAALDALKIPHDVRGDEIALRDIPVVIRVVTANFRTAVGELCLFVWCDEVSRWRDEATGENPATEVIGSLKPALATVPEAPLFLVSSPLSTLDYHAKSFDRGDDDEQLTGFCPTWIGNPVQFPSEAYTRTLEKDERFWLREYAAQPLATGLHPAFGPELESAIVDTLPTGYILAPWLACDLAERNDGDGWAHGYHLVPLAERDRLPVMRVAPSGAHSIVRDADGEIVLQPTVAHPTIVVAGAGEFPGDTPWDAVARRFAGHCQAHGIGEIWGDQRGDAGMSSLLRPLGVRYRSFHWSVESKTEAIEHLVRLMREGRLLIVRGACDGMVKELRALQFRPRDGGSLDYRTHGQDQASALITAAHAWTSDEAHRVDRTPPRLPDDPNRAGFGRREFHNARESYSH